MDKIVIYCKSFAGDIKAVSKMIESFEKYNLDNIQMYLSCPHQDIDLFKRFNSTNIQVLEDESYASNHMISQTKTGLAIGYINQQICKLCFWETGIAENYFCVDSDAIFIKNFTYDDFMFDDDTPYSILHMDKDLACDKMYQKFWDYRQFNIEKIKAFISYNGKLFKTCHGFQIFNSKVLKELQIFCSNKNVSYGDLLEIAPFEFSWYNAMLQKCNVIKIVEIEPLVKCFHNRADYNEFQRRNIGVEDMRRQYIGIVMNSNWNLFNRPYKNPGIIFKISCFIKKCTNKCLSLYVRYMRKR